MLFRLANFFNPRHMLQVGAATGIESVAMLEVSRNSRLYLFDLQLEQKALAVRVLQSQLDRIACYDDLKVGVDELLSAADGSAMALINVPVAEEVLKRLLNAGVVVILRNINRDEALSSLFDACCDHMPAGQTYTNNKIAILNPNPKLQREDFILWL